MASVSPCPVLGYAVEADAEVRAEGVVARRRAAAAVPAVDAVGRGRGPARAARGAAGPERAGRRRGGAVVRRALRRRGVRPRRPRPGRRCAWRCTASRTVPSWSSTATTPTRPRPRRRCGRWPRCRAERKLALLGLMAELGAETEAEHRRVARLAEELGIEVVGLPDRPLRGGPGGRRRRRRRAAADAGPGRRRPGQGQPGGAARGRRRGAYGAASRRSVAGGRRVARRRAVGDARRRRGPGG